MTRDSRSDATDEQDPTTHDPTGAPGTDERTRSGTTADPGDPGTDGAGPARNGGAGDDGVPRVVLGDGASPDAVAGVPVEERTAVADEDHVECHQRFDGIAVVGVTDDDGRVLTMVDGDDHAILPHGPVEPGEDFAAVARRTVADQLDVPVVLDAVARARRIEYRLASGDERGSGEGRRATTHQVVFRASLPEWVAPESQRGCWSACWTDHVPDNPDWDREEVRGDVRALLGTADRATEDR